MDAHNVGPVPSLAPPALLQGHRVNDLVPLGTGAHTAPDVETPQAGDDGAGRDKDQENRQSNSASNEANRKAIAAMQARAGLAGYELHALADGTLLITRWAWCRPLADLAAAERFLEQIGGRP